ncbi:MAG: 2'-5' RNA ligase family protein [Solirubrobacterales bacterium]
MKYYLVALLDKNSNEHLEQVQRNICKKYKLFKGTPLLYIPLEVIGDPDVDKLSRVVSDIVKPYKKFKVSINGAECSNSAMKFANLKIENKGYIVRLTRHFNEKLKMNGFDVKENHQEHQLCIPLSGNLFHSKESVKDNNDNVKNENINRMVTIDRIELWKNVNNKKDMLVKKFQLREY